MNEEIVFANDTHYFGPHALGNPDDLYNHNVDYLLGDIVDLHLVKKKQINECKILRSKLVSDFKDKYISGNHSLNTWNMEKVIEVGGHRILLTHGDIVFKGMDYALEYRAKKPGSGRFLRWGARMVDYWRMNHRDPKIKIETTINAAKLAEKHNCKTVICGHSHRMKLGHDSISGVDLYILPRGINRCQITNGKLVILEQVVSYETHYR